MMSSQNTFTKDTKEHGKILKKVGLLLLVFGLLGLGAAFLGSSSGVPGLAYIVAGIVLMSGNLTAARVVRWYFAFVLTYTLGATIIMPVAGISLSWFHQPIALQIEALKLLDPEFIIIYLVFFVTLGVYLWAYLQLSSRPVIEARNEAKLKPMGFPVSAVIIAGTLVLGIIAALYNTDDSEYHIWARNKAKAIHGDAYSYHVSSVEFENARVIAHVKAYKSGEILPVTLEWNGYPMHITGEEDAE